RIQIAGMLDHSRKHRALRQVQLLQVFAEVGLRRLAETVNGKASLLPQGNFVGVELKNLLLVKAVLQLKSDGDLYDFPLQTLLGGEEEAARQLHGERGPTLPPLPHPQVVTRRP